MHTQSNFLKLSTNYVFFSYKGLVAEIETDETETGTADGPNREIEESALVHAIENVVRGPGNIGGGPGKFSFC